MNTYPLVRDVPLEAAVKDEVLKSYIANFAADNDVDNLEFSEQFEHFSNYCIVSKQYPREFDYDDLIDWSGQRYWD
jgi:hypothetical protein